MVSIWFAPVTIFWAADSCQITYFFRKKKFFFYLMSLFAVKINVVWLLKHFFSCNYNDLKWKNMEQSL